MALARSRRAKNRLTPALLLGCALALAPACSKQMWKSLAEMRALRDALAREFGVQEVAVTANPEAVVVTFFNSRFNEVGDAERAKKGRDIAVFVKKNYAAAGRSRIIMVAFAVSQSYLNFFHRSEVLAVYPFEVAALGDYDPLTEPRSRGATAGASYNKWQNQTTVAVNHLTLRGDLNDGLILIPTFTVAGERVREPRWVDLEFGSFSKREIFTRDRRIEIHVDGEKLLAGDARLISSGKSEAGAVTEFVSQRLTYQQFLRLAVGREVRIRLGGAEVELTPEHLASLREMKTCVDNSKCG